MKRLSLLLLPAVLVVGLAAGCSKSNDTTTAANDQAKQADQLLGGGNCVQLATTWGQLFVPLSSGGASDADKAKIKTQIADIKSKVPANVGKSLDTINQGIENAKTTADVQKFVTSPEFTKANQDVNTYLTTECSKLGK